MQNNTEKVVKNIYIDGFPGIRRVPLLYTHIESIPWILHYLNSIRPGTFTACQCKRPGMVYDRRVFGFKIDFIVVTKNFIGAHNWLNLVASNCVQKP